MPPRPTRIAVLIDHQNVYRDARAAFHRPGAPASAGQVDPVEMAYALALAGQTRPGVRRVTNVRVYTGTPSPHRDPRTYAAYQRQREVWTRQGVRVIDRNLRYPPGWPNEPARQKGVDVALAVDLVAGALRRRFDVVIVASTDQDLAPAIEAVTILTPRVKVEVVGWTPLRKRLRAEIGPLWCHWITRDIYESIRDRRDYRRF